MLAGVVAVSAACLIWGFNYVPTKIAIDEIDPLAILLVRLVFSTLLYLGLLFISRQSLRSILVHWRLGLLLALLNVTGDQLLFLVGLKFTTASHAAMMYALVPIFTAILASVLINEKANLLRIAGIGIAFVGAMILATEDGITFESQYLVGDLCILGAALCWSLYIVLSKPLVMRIGTVQTLSLVFVIGIPLALPLTIISTITQPWHSVTPLAYASVASIILGATFAGMLCYQFALKKLPASVVALFSYTIPVIVAVFSVFLLGETLSPIFYAASSLIFIGLLVARVRKR